MSRTVLLELTFDRDVDFSSVEALVDSHTDDEGVVAVSGRLATAPATRIIQNDDGE
jgi:hypothetical protein